MRITVKKIIDIETGQILYHDWYEYNGEIIEFKYGLEGLAGQARSLAGGQASFFNQLVSSFTQVFGTQQGILNGLRQVWEPIFQSGGIGAGIPAVTALRTNTTENVTQAYQNAKQAVNEQMAARGGGNAYVPSGVEDEINAQLTSNAAKTQATTQNEITTNLFKEASDVLGGIASMENPSPYASTAVNAGEAAQKGLTSAANLSEIAGQTSGWSQFGKIAGGVAESLFAPGLAGIGANIASDILGGGGGGSSSTFEPGSTISSSTGYTLGGGFAT
jgi:hypothetical protein